LNAEDGPADVLFRLRRLAGEGFLGSLLDCFYCLSIWTAAPFAYLLGADVKEQLLLWPALSAGAILIERLSGAASGGPSAPPIEYEEGDNPNGLLRK
jgi:hypothetical protein